MKGVVQKTPGINGKQIQVLIKLSNNLEYGLINYKVHGCISHQCPRVPHRRSLNVDAEELCFLGAPPWQSLSLSPPLG
jgi:hypothetical protein